MVLEERGVHTKEMTGEKFLLAMLTLKVNRSIYMYLIEEKGYIHVAYMLPKFHCELNPFERAWAQSKCYAKAYCKYDIQSLHNNIIPALDTLTLDNMQNYSRKEVRHYMLGYLEGVPGGSDWEKLFKDYKKAIKFH